MLTKRAWPSTLSAVLLTCAALACATTPAPTSGVPATASVAGAPATSSQPSAPAVPSVPPTTEPAAPTIPVFTVAVIADLQSEPVTREQAQAVIDEASGFLHRLTSISLLMTDFVEDAGGESTSDMATRYVSAHAGAVPNGLVIFSFGDGGRAKREGGYGSAVAGPTGFRNAFSSPVTGNNQVYMAVVQFNYKYAACGYAGSDTAGSTTSLEGECRNQPGTACIQHNGYSICSDSVAHLYASTPTYFVSSTIVHQLMHPFSPGGDADHYDTPDCNTRMGYPAQFHDLQEAQYYNGLCPYVYEEFGRSYQP